MTPQQPTIKKIIPLINLDTVSEWLYFSIIADHDTDSLEALLTSTLATTFLTQPLISEAEIDEAIAMDKEYLEQRLKAKQISASTYQQQCQSIDRETVKQELITAGSGEQLEEGLAACLLTAVLLAPQPSELSRLFAHNGDEFQHRFQSMVASIDLQRLKPQLTKASAITLQARQSNSMIDCLSNQQWRQALDSLIGYLDNSSNRP